MRILAVDPGSTQSAWLLWDTANVAPVRSFAIQPNDQVLAWMRHGPIGIGADVMVIEQIESYGMTVGREIFDTVHWSGRFTEAVRPLPVVQLPRRAVKLAICQDSRAKDANIRQALLDRFGPQGTKAAPGVLHGISKDVWSALAIAVTFAETGEEVA